jgi:hypothetical protein
MQSHRFECKESCELDINSQSFFFHGGFLKVDCLDLALSRRIFAGNCDKEPPRLRAALPLAPTCTFSVLSLFPQTVAAAAILG